MGVLTSPAQPVGSADMDPRPQVDEPSTEALLHAAAQGDQRAWDSLVDRYARLVWSVVRSFRLDDAAAHDVFQTTWLRLVEHLHRIREPDRLAAWLAQTTRNEALRTLRLQRRQQPTDVLGVLPDRTVPEPAEVVVDAETRAAVAAALGQLGEGCQQLLRLLCAQPPLDYATIAELLGRPIGSLGPTRQRCLDKLRGLLAPGGG